MSTKDKVTTEDRSKEKEKERNKERYRVVNTNRAIRVITMHSNKLLFFLRQSWQTIIFFIMSCRYFENYDFFLSIVLTVY